MPKLGIISDERYLNHITGPYHPERPERLIAINEVLDKATGLVAIPTRFATKEEITAIHDPALYERVMATRGITRYAFDADTPVSAGSADAALLAAGGVLNLTDAVWRGEVDVGFASIRPPGHHAEPARAMGFCLFNNIAIAAEHLVKTHGLKRVAIIDYDVHHGNGTQNAFYTRRDVFFTSLHRFPFYPYSGAATETGAGEGAGFTFNVPLDAWADDDDYKKAFENTSRAVDDFKPEFILVSAGFDAHERDPLGGMKLSQKGYEFMNEQIAKLAFKHCAGKIVFVLEGGYDLKGLQEGVEAILTTVS